MLNDPAVKGFFLCDQWSGAHIKALEPEIVTGVRQDDTVRRPTTIPLIGPITAATIQALVPDPAAFTSGRHFAAWIGLTPKNNVSGQPAPRGGRAC